MDLLDRQVMNGQKIAPAAIVALKQALTDLYWYKNDLRGFLSNTLRGSSALINVNWDDYKRNIVNAVVDSLCRRLDSGTDELLNLMYEVGRVDDFSHLERLEDGADKAKKARASVMALRKLTAGHETLLNERRAAEERRARALADAAAKSAVRERLDSLATEFRVLLVERDPQKRGYALERLIGALFDLFDMDPRASFRNIGEQIDGAFTFDGTDYLFEAKWQSQPVDPASLDSLRGKLSRKLDNTLGVFLSINGFSEGSVAITSAGRSTVLLMDGADLNAVLEGRIELPALLLRKRRHASETGNVYLRVEEIFRAC